MAVLAHEVGHYKETHLSRSCNINFSNWINDILLELCLNNEILIKSLGGTTPAFT